MSKKTGRTDMSKITVNTLAELQNLIGRPQKQTQRESFEKRFGIREAYSGPGTRAWADERDSRVEAMSIDPPQGELMQPHEHYLEAERLLEIRSWDPILLAEAQIHATLALASLKKTSTTYIGRIMMRDLLNYEEVLSKVTYKPNVNLSVYGAGDVWKLRVQMWIEDSRKPLERWEVRPRSMQYFGPQRPLESVSRTICIPMFVKGDEHGFLNWIRYVLLDMENHELDEWFRYNGELVNDPHKEN